MTRETYARLLLVFHEIGGDRRLTGVGERNGWRCEHPTCGDDEDAMKLTKEVGHDLFTSNEGAIGA
jgi:hypothetical protein